MDGERLREALTDVQFAHRHLLGDSDVTREDASGALVEAERRLRALTEAPPSESLERTERTLSALLRMTQDEDYDVWARRLIACGTRPPSDADVVAASNRVLLETWDQAAAGLARLSDAARLTESGEP